MVFLKEDKGQEIKTSLLELTELGLEFILTLQVNIRDFNFTTADKNSE